MFRMGGSSGTGITSGLDQPRKQYAEGSEDKFMELVSELREAGFSQQEAIEEARKRLSESKAMGGRIGYQQGSMPNFQFSGMPGFLTNFGLNLLATPPQGNIFQTAAVAARDPFNQLQTSQAAASKTAAEREFLRGERIAGDEAAMERLETKLASDERLAGMKTNDALYNVMLEQFIENDLPPQVAERAALFSTEKADDLRAAVTGTRYGGVLQFDIRDPSNQNLVKKNLGGKVVYDPFEDNYKYIVIRSGEVYFDEFDSIADIKFPEIGTGITEQKKRKPAPDIFSPDIDDVSGA